MTFALLNTAEMGDADRLATAGGISGPELMHRAGEAIADAVCRRWSVRPVAVLCGPGNNGGDGFVVARLLAARGWPVRLALLGTRERLISGAAYHAALWEDSVELLSPGVLDESRLVVDALFGAGLSRALDGVAEKTLRAVAVPLVAVDVPSGVDGNTGLVQGYAPQAELTVTFFREKPGHWLYPGRGLCGEVVLADIGIPADVLDEIGPKTFRNEPGLWVLPSLDVRTHKYKRGACLVAAGAMPGAAALAASAALRIGAGLVSVAVPLGGEAALGRLPAAVVQRACPDLPSYAGLAGEERLASLVLGPGAGADGRTRRRVEAALAIGKPCVLDADGLTAFREEPDRLFRALRGTAAVLTPHAGEFAQLFPDLAEQDKLSAARMAATRSGAVVLMKGPDTIVAAPDGKVAINGNAPAWLATAGSGDVLAGIIGGLLARGMASFEAAAAGAWVHGAAAQAHGAGMIADDLLANLPKALGEAQVS